MLKFLPDIKEAIFAGIGVLVGYIGKSFWDRRKRKKKHDEKIYHEITNLISPDLMKDFFSSLKQNLYAGEHSSAIFAYFDFSKNVDKYFFDKTIQNSKIYFDKWLDELMQFLGQYFSRPNNAGHNHYQLLPNRFNGIWNEADRAKVDEIFRKCENQLDALQDEVEEEYKKFIETAKNRLLI